MSVKYVIYNVDDYLKHKDKDNTFYGDHKKCNCLNYEKDNNGNYIYNKDTIIFDRCNSLSETKDGFCQKHKDCFDFMKLFTNGYEPEYEPKKWNSYKFVKGSHNCYAYFLDAPNRSLTIKCEELCYDDINCPDSNNTCRDLIPQPGDAALILKDGSTQRKPKEYLCPNMIKRIKADNPKIKQTNFTNKCPDNYFKGAMVVDHKNTFHFYRLNKDGVWSHKPGITSVKTVDAYGKPIAVPHFADRNYVRNGSSNINYDDFCGYFCIPHNNQGSKYFA
jgi:hypothetical protein